MNLCLAISHWLLNFELGVGRVTSRGLHNLHHGLELLVGSRGVEEKILLGQRPAEYAPGRLDPSRGWRWPQPISISFLPTVRVSKALCLVRIPQKRGQQRQLGLQS